jgi:hypothetical protein
MINPKYLVKEFLKLLQFQIHVIIFSFNEIFYMFCIDINNTRSVGFRNFEEEKNQLIF